MAPNMTDYAATCREFRLAVPARFNWAFDVFDAWGRDPKKLALLWVSGLWLVRRFTKIRLAAFGAAERLLERLLRRPQRRLGLEPGLLDPHRDLGHSGAGRSGRLP